MARILFFDSVGGASGDMILAALVGLGGDLSGFMEEYLPRLLPEGGVEISVSDAVDNGICGTRVKVTDDSGHHHAPGHHHPHRHLSDIEKIMTAAALPERVFGDTMRVFRVLAEAEAKAHGTSPEKVGFHEVGAWDSIIDIAASCCLIADLKIDRICFSTLPLGCGTTSCQHGIIPVPVPATLEILRNCQVMRTDEPFELVTPTGAAILSTLGKQDGDEVSGLVVAVATALGHRELRARPNILRASIIETDQSRVSEIEKVCLLECDIDDATPELMGGCFERFMTMGALDVTLTPVIMKKNRPGTTLAVLCRPNDKDELLRAVFRHTSTFGVREAIFDRHVLERRIELVDTLYGKIRVKVGCLNGDDVTFSPEYDDCAKLAADSGMPIKAVYNAALAAVAEKPPAGLV